MYNHNAPKKLENKKEYRLWFDLGSHLAAPWTSSKILGEDFYSCQSVVG